MERLKLLIAEGTEDFRIALAELLQGIYVVRECSDGSQAMELMHSFVPDILVLDLMLPGLDGISLLQSAAEEGLTPMVLATTRFVSDYVMDAVDRLGVEYLMVKPCDVRATVSRIGDLSKRIKRPPLFAQPDPKSYISNLLLTLGIPTKLKGYGYLREAVQLMAKDPDQSVTKELYPAVAEVCGGAAVHVERSVRSAISAAWERKDEELWRQYFPADGDGFIHRPTNASFITRLADSLKLECKMG
jgi:DNA-binding response OmpR family regulator